jgi:hypothetical protein
VEVVFEEVVEQSQRAAERAVEQKLLMGWKAVVTVLLQRKLEELVELEKSEELEELWQIVIE